MKRKFIIGGIILLIPIVFLGYMGFKSAITYYYEVDELLAKGAEVYDENVRVGGRVLPGIVMDAASFERRFTIIDIESRGGTIPVVHRGSVPDTFAENVDVIVEGKLNSAGVFEATSIATQCASKYIPAEAREN